LEAQLLGTESNSINKNSPVILEIQLLRAVAILLVIGFHLGWRIFEFGFLGVDIFFVISGYFMYNIYFRLTENKLKTFYLKRIKRLLPAFLFTTLIGTLFFLTIALPFERTLLVTHNLYSNLVLSNFYFWSQNQYFTDGELRPFLNFWSLALEIQFYLIFPLVYKIIMRSRIAFLLIFGFSLLIYSTLNYISPETAFFMMPARLWQFQMGMLVAYLLSKNEAAKIIFIFSKIIKFSIWLFFFLILLFSQFIEQQNFMLNVLVSLLTAIILGSSGLNQKSLNVVDKVGLLIGKYSYSLYLTHLPVITIISYEPFKGNLFPKGFYQTFVAIFLFTGCALVLHHLIEQPFRSLDSITILGSTYSISLLVSFILFVSMPSLKNFGTPEVIRKISAGVEDGYKYRCGLLSRIEILHELTGRPNSCLLTKNHRGKNFLLIGNSHANAIQNELRKAVENSGNSLFLVRDPSPISLQFKSITEEVKRNEISFIIIHSRFGSEKLESIRSLGEFAKMIGVKIILIGPVPTYSQSVPYALYKNISTGQKFNFKTRSDFEATYFEEISSYKSLDSRTFLYIDVLEVFCEFTCTVVDKNSGIPLYFDDHHLTNVGAKKLVNSVWPKIYSSYYPLINS